MNLRTLGVRITIGFVVTLSLTAALGGFARTRLKMIREHARHISQDALPGIFLSGRIEALAHETGMIVLKNLLSVNEDQRDEYATKIETNVRELANLATEYSRTVAGTEARQRFQKLDDVRSEYADVIGKLLTLSRGGKTQEAMELKVKQLDPTFERLIETARSEVAAGKRNSDEASAGIAKSVASAEDGINTGLLAAVLASAFVGGFITLLTTRALRGVTHSINNSTRHVASQAVALDAASTAVSRGAGEQSQALRDTRGTLNNLATIATKTAEQSQHAEKLARQARSATSTAAASTTEMAAAMKAIKETNADMSSVTSGLSTAAGELQTAVDAIQASSREVAKFVAIVDQMAAQTTILALNASVEAARAGDAGRSFAVVAAEVKSLAQRSGIASRDIGSRIKDMVERGEKGARVSARMIESIRALTQRATDVRIGVDESSARAAEIESALHHIAQLTQNVDEFVTHVATAAGEQSTSVSRISTAVGRMNEVTELNASQAAESITAVQALREEVARLNEAVARLRNLAGGSADTDEDTPNDSPPPPPNAPTEQSSQYARATSNGAHPETVEHR